MGIIDDDVAARVLVLAAILLVLAIGFFIQGGRRAAVANREARMLRSVIDSWPTPLSLCDRQRNCLIANSAFRRWYGIGENEPIDDYVGAVTRPMESPGTAAIRVADHEKRVVQSGQAVTEERELHCGDGTTRHISVTKFPVRGENGELTAIGTTTADITDRKAAARALAESERGLRALIDSWPAPVALFTVDGVLTNANAAFRRLHDIAALSGKARYSDLATRNLRDPEAAKMRIDAKVRQALDTGEAATDEREEKYADGTVRHVIAITFPVTAEDEAILAVGSIHVDITERKAAEQALVERERELRAIVDHLPESLSVVDLEGRFTLMNLTFADRYRCDREWAIGKDRATVFAGTVFSQLTDASREQEQWVRNNLRAHHREDRRRHPDGIERPVIVTRFPILASDGSLRAIGVASFDITEREKSEQALTESERRLRAVIDSWPAPVTLFTPDGTLISANAAFRKEHAIEELSGTVSYRDLVTRHLADPEAGKARIAAQERRVVETRLPQSEEREMRFADGSARHLISIKFPVLGKDGDIIAIGSTLLDITERKLAERAMAEREQELRTVVDHLPVALTVVDSEGRFTLMNRSYASQYRIDREQALGRHRAEVFIETSIGPLSRDSEIQEQQVRETLQVCRRETRRRHPDGVERAIIITRFPILAADGSLRSVGMISIDITERKRAEEALRDSEARFRTLIEQASDGIILHDVHGRIIEANAAACRQGGYTREQFLARNVAEMVDGDPQRLLAQWQGIKVGENVTYANHRIAADGSAIPVEARIGAIEIGGVKLILAIVRDDSERQAAARSLRLSEARFQSVFDHAPVGIYLKDTEGRFLLVNRTYREWAGITGLALPEQAGSGAAATSAPDGALREGERQCLQNRELVEFERAWTAPDGQRRILSTVLFPIMGGDGEPVGTGGIDIDVTDSRMARELAEAKEAADQANRAKSAFLASMSHEIRTPMNGVVGFAELLQSEVDRPLSGRQQTFVGNIVEGSKHLLGLIDDILDFSKIEAGKMELERVATPLLDVVEGIVETLAPAARRKDIKLLSFVDPDLPAGVVGDPLRLRQILLNLAGNAVKFTDRGEVVVRADRQEGPPDGPVIVRFSIVDQGIGMSRDILDRLFTPFQQAESSTTRRFGGTGLGLSISSRLVQLMGGSIAVDSTPGVGSCFTATIPFEPLGGGMAEATVEDLSGVDVLLLLRSVTEADFLARYLRHRRATVRIAAGLPAVAAWAAATERGAATCRVAVVDGEGDGAERPPLKAALGEQRFPGSTRFVRLRRPGDASAHPPPVGAETVDSPGNRRLAFAAAVAIAAGRASPEPSVSSIAPPQLSATPTSREEAAAQGQLILVAEDNEINRAVIRHQLQALGYAADIAVDGEAALASWQAGDYAMVLTDCHMPRMDGFSLTDAIRRHEAGSGRRTPIVAVTANAMKGEAERCLRAGMDDYLSKPVRMEELNDKLVRWMPARRAAETASGGPPLPATAVILPAEAAPASVIDRTVLGDVLGGDEAMILDLLDRFVVLSRDDAETLRRTVDRRGPDAVGAAHKLKSGARGVGATRVAAICQDIEEGARHGRWQAVEAALSCLEQAVADVAGYAAARRGS